MSYISHGGTTRPTTTTTLTLHVEEVVWGTQGRLARTIHGRTMDFGALQLIRKHREIKGQKINF